MISLQQLVEELGTGDGTLRYRIKHYKEFLPSHDVEGSRERWFDDDALFILKMIDEEIKRKTPKGEIKKLLAEKFPKTIEPPKDNKAQLDLVDVDAAPIQSNHKNAIDNATIKQLHNECVLLFRANDRLLETIGRKERTLEIKDKEIEQLLSQKTEAEKQLRQEQEKREQLAGKVEELKQELEKSKRGSWFWK